MVWNAISNVAVAVFYLIESVVVGVVRFVVTLLGPGLTVFLVAIAAALWWFGWI